MKNAAEEFALGVDPKSLHVMILMQTVYNAVLQHSRGFLKHVMISVFEMREITMCRLELSMSNCDSNVNLAPSPAS